MYYFILQYYKTNRSIWICPSAHIVSYDCLESSIVNMGNIGDNPGNACVECFVTLTLIRSAKLK